MKSPTVQARTSFPLGDSKEALLEYYGTRKMQLEKALNRLNILEHPVEIRSICSKIIAVKKILNQRNRLRKAC
jgi:hypothetical protein